MYHVVKTPSPLKVNSETNNFFKSTNKKTPTNKIKIKNKKYSKFYAGFPDLERAPGIECYSNK